MTKHLCPYTTSDQNNYSAPVPFIGLYIAAATALCFLLMFGDVLNGIRHRKPWLPCRYFPLNSFTLALLVVAAKIPVDLTTDMPSAYDQLSKLTGTSLVCVCMVFLLPSIGSTRSSESVPNIAALSILVITIVVNICVQLSTGVIFSFFTEHVIIMSCMLIMVILFWSSNWEIITYKELQMDRKKDLLTKGGECLFTRLKLYYLHGFDSNPQFKICECRYTLYAGLASLTCLVVVLQATIRSLISHEFSFCTGTSDYGWSIKIIVATQILVILLTSFAVYIRESASSRLWHSLPDSLELQIINPMLVSFPFLKGNTMDYLNVVMRNAVKVMVVLMTIFYLVQFLTISFVSFIVGIAACPVTCCLLPCIACIGLCCLMRDDTESQGIKEYQDLRSENDLELEDRTLTKCAENVIRWSEKGKSLGHLKDMFSERPPSQYSLQELKSQIGLEERKEISCLHLVFLVKVASVSTQSTICGHLTRKVFDITQFVDDKLNSSTFTNRKRRTLAKAMWKGKDFISPLPMVEGPKDGSQSEKDHALDIIGKLKDVLFTSEVWEELDFIMNSINGQEYKSVKELQNFLEQLFVDMLYIFLSQLPCAIYKHVNESQVEDYEESVRCTLKFLGQVQSLDGMAGWSWSFPDGIGIQRLMPPQASSTDQNNTGGTSDSAIVIATPMYQLMSVSSKSSWKLLKKSESASLWWSMLGARPSTSSISKGSTSSTSMATVDRACSS